MEKVSEPKKVESTTSGLPPQSRATKTSLRIRTLAVGLSLLIIGAGIGFQYGRMVDSGMGFGLIKPMTLSREDLDFSQFWEVWDTLEATYLDTEKIDQKALIQGAIRGMTAAVGDPYTVYLPPAENQQSKEDLNGEFEGVGIQLGYIKGTVAVQTPLENHPAIKAGVKAGDLILRIVDEEKGVDEETVGMTLQEAVRLIRGKKGSPVTLTFYREDKGTFDLTIERDTITMPSVELTFGQWDEQGFEESETGQVAWLRVYRFGENTQEQWDEAVTQILQRRDQVKGIVLDVRNNPGGLLQASIDLASDFIPEGVVVKQEGKIESETYSVTKRARLLGYPLTVLINKGSASASEILAGALRDRLDVKLVGENSFGKGTVQQVLDLRQGAGVHVTVARWVLPKGEWIGETGLAPAIEVSLPDVDEASDSADFVDTQLEAAIEALGL
jgi:carboxyl-terminal processing protease